MLILQPARLRSAMLIFVCCATPSLVSAKRLRSPAELVPKPSKVRLQVGSLLLRRCKDVPAYCGSIPRPLDPADTAAGTIKIGFQFYPHLDTATPPLETIVATEGGPGYPTTGTRHSYIALFYPLMDRHDFLLVDDRGTGSSGAVDCPLLQREPNPQHAGITACGQSMGKSAYLYGSKLAADDLAAVLDALAIRRIDLYGDSYGTYFGQTFANRHPQRLRSLVLDGAYPAAGLSPWYPEIAPTIRQALRLACERARSCDDLHGDSVTRIDELAGKLRQHPLSGRAQDGDGKLVDVTADASTLAYLMFSNATALVVYRELDAAARAYLEHQDSLPLLRLLAEGQKAGQSGGKEVHPVSYSAAIFVSASCTDYPQIYEMTATHAARMEERERALAQKQLSDPEVYAPFTVREFDAMSLDTSVLSLCLNWPQAPAQIDPGRPIPQGAVYPDVPVLVLSGEFDPLTPWPQGAEAAKWFPNARYIVVKNSTHVTALSDQDNCGSELVRRFVEHLDPGDTSCAANIAEVHLVAKFVSRAAELEPAVATAGSEAEPDDLRIAAAAAHTIGDALARWWVNDNGKGAGLRGGRFTYKTSGSHSLYKFNKLLWTEDVEVSGTADWDYNFPGRVSAHVKITGPRREQGDLTLTWNSRAADSDTQISGEIGRRKIHASIYAPF